MGDVTLMLGAARAGEPGAEDRLWEAVYQELRGMAAGKMSGEARAITLSATALVHEAWLRIAGPSGGSQEWDGRAHFFSAAAEAMRRILVDQARRRISQKRGGGCGHEPLDDITSISAPDDGKLLEVHELIDALAAENEQLARITKLRFFVGLSAKETGDVLGISEKTVQRHWIQARTWLYEAIKSSPQQPPADGAQPD